MRVKYIVERKCEFTHRVRSYAIEEMLMLLARQGIPLDLFRAQRQPASFAHNQGKRHGIHRLIVVGQIAQTCIESTVRFAAELGYDVAVVRNAVADYSDDRMHTALEINMPNYARDIVNANEIVDALWVAVSAR